LAPSEQEALTRADCIIERRLLKVDAMEPLVLTVNETADLLKLCPATIRTMYRAGELKGNQRGHAIRLYRESVEAWARNERSMERAA
jgi:excisionase family DNA binding protein